MPCSVPLPMQVPRFGRLTSVECLTLVLIEVLDENEESDFQVISAVLTRED